MERVIDRLRRAIRDEESVTFFFEETRKTYLIVSTKNGRKPETIYKIEPERLEESLVWLERLLEES